MSESLYPAKREKTSPFNEFHTECKGASILNPHNLIPTERTEEVISRGRFLCLLVSIYVTGNQGFHFYFDTMYLMY